MRAPTAPERGPSKMCSSHPVFPDADGAVALAAVRPAARRYGGRTQNKKWRLRTAANEACFDPLLWHPGGTPRKSARLGWFGKPRKTLAFLACFWKPLEMGLGQRPVGLRSLLAFDFAEDFNGAQGQNRTADTRIFSPNLAVVFSLKFNGIGISWHPGGAPRGKTDFPKMEFYFHFWECGSRNP